MTGYSPIKKMYSICPVATTPESAVRNEQMIQGKFLEPNSVAWIRSGECRTGDWGARLCMGGVY